MKTTTKFLLLFTSLFLFFACSNEEDGGDSCGKVTEISYYTTPTTIYVSFIKGNDANSTKIEVGRAGFTQGTGTVITTSNTNYILENLSPSTTYDVYFTGICTETNQSVVKKLSSITTQPGECVGNASVSFSQTVTSTLDLNFTYTANNPDYYQVEYGLQGFTLGSGTRVMSPLSSSYMPINGLQASTTYDFYVRAICNRSEQNDASNFIRYTYTTVSSCPAPSNLNSYITSGTCSTGATRMFTWNSSINAQSYTICVVRAGDQPSTTSNAFTSTVNSKSLSNVTCSFIGFYVRANCSATESSAWAGPFYF